MIIEFKLNSTNVNVLALFIFSTYIFRRDSKSINLDKHDF